MKLPARIDTGSDVCSLDARELKIDKEWAEFKLPEAYGGLRLRLPVIRWRVVRSANSHKKRPVVEVKLLLGPRQLRAEVNLEDRSKVKYPMLIGRNVLRQGFVVDPSKANIAPPQIRGGRAP
ncbi:MAG: ATP-dependent zinc protease [Deltaproteobacteria bacterium]|nr:ATP-dependent zinc protease [Deltaproteobacteria bacterium]